jgi:hypothetical protein
MSSSAPLQAERISVQSLLVVPRVYRCTGEKFKLGCLDCKSSPLLNGGKLSDSALDVSSEEPGLPGELICRQAFPIIPLGFWPLAGYGFPEAEVTAAQARFQESYFKDEEGNWYHGD